MPNTITHKTSLTAGKTPREEDLAFGELAINANDGILYAKMSDNSIRQLEFSASLLDYGMASEVATKQEDLGFISEVPSNGILYGGI